MTVFENIAFGLMPNDLPEDEIKVKVDEIARILNITHLLERKPKELSSGQKQRVALGRALISDNKIVLLDEPLANLDERLRFWMRTEFLKIHKMADKTFIYVTHHPAEAMALATSRSPDETGPSDFRSSTSTPNSRRFVRRGRAGRPGR
jgi:multiple sugar transport system ATP-binding protein